MQHTTPEPDTRAMPNGTERPGEHWNARLIREAAERERVAQDTADNSGYDIPTDDLIRVTAPDDDDAAFVWFGRRAPRDDEYVLTLGDVNDGGVGYAGTLDELEEFALTMLARVRSAANKCPTCGEHIADPHAPFCPDGCPADAVTYAEIKAHAMGAATLATA